MDASFSDPDRHPFLSRPHRTLVALSVPAFVSQIAVPLTDLADLAFVARLGSEAASALGAATAILSGFVWVLFFLAVGTHTEVAQANGAGDHDRAKCAAGVALALAVILGTLVAILLVPFKAPLMEFMGARDGIHTAAVDYLRIRLFGLPASLVMGVAFGVMRGYQDMKTPAWISIITNALNIALDPLFIWGAGPIPAWGIAGAAGASVVSHWLAAIWTVVSLRRRVGWSRARSMRMVGRLFLIGRDLLIRAGLMNLFLLMTTRMATTIGPEAGAAHLAVTRVWSFTAFFLDAFAYAAQSLVGFFVGAKRIVQARRVASVSTWWSLGAGVALAVALFLLEPIVRRGLVPPEAWPLFGAAWTVSALTQPINSISFITDGIHWGTGDYFYLRNATVVSVGLGLLALFLVRPDSENALVQLWLVTGLWITARGILGVIRVWPGIGHAPLALELVSPAETTREG